MSFHEMDYADIIEQRPDLEVSFAQRLGVDTLGRILADDGIAGKLTRGGTFVDPWAYGCVPHLDLALREILRGAREIGGNNLGPFVHKYTRVAGRYGEPWCAAFISWCLRTAYGDEAPVSGGARALGRKVAKWGGRFTDWRDARAGDLVVFSRGKLPWQGHIGIVVAVYGNGILYIDGNTGRFPSPVRVRFLHGPDRSKNSRLLYIARPPAIQ